MTFTTIPCTQNIRALVRTDMMTGGVPRTRLEPVIGWLVAPNQDDLVDAEVYPVGVRGVIHNVVSFVDYETGKDI
jgi:hypothetical protein